MFLINNTVFMTFKLIISIINFTDNENYINQIILLLYYLNLIFLFY